MCRNFKIEESFSLLGFLIGKFEIFEIEKFDDLIKTMREYPLGQGYFGNLNREGCTQNKNKSGSRESEIRLKRVFFLINWIN